MRKNYTPARLGTVYVARASIQVISGEKWQTLCTCADTPNAIRDTIARCRKLSSAPLDIWVMDAWGDRKYIGR